MGFEIITKEKMNDKKVDLEVVFDQEDKMYIDNKILHAYASNEKEEIKKIYTDLFNLISTLDIETLSLPAMPLVKYQNLKNDIAFTLALLAIEDFLNNNEMNIYLVIDFFIEFTGNSYAERHLYHDITSLIVADNPQSHRPHNPCRSRKLMEFHDEPVHYAVNDYLSENIFNEFNIDEELKNSKEVSFGQHLLDVIDEKGYAKYSTVYKKALVRRGVFHNIISNDDYLPKKNTVITLALALELNEEEAKEFLGYAGYAFSNTRKDQILLICFRKKYYNVMRINGYLYDSGLMPLLNLE